ncbi:MAG: hypothetical protein ACJ75B_12475 [Flavisolibacter sp.]
MKQQHVRLALIFAFSVFLFSCQKELHFQFNEQSDGSLLAGTDHTCQPIIVGGNFIAGSNLNDSNFLEVSVQVISPGTYLITSDTLNGYSFHASGSFSGTGTIKVKMQATGRPLKQEDDHFSIRYNNTTCEVVIAVQSNPLQPAVFQLQGSPGQCMNFSLSGNYVKNIALDTGSKLTIQVMVSTPGSYFITTDTVNGFSFSASGVWATAGLHTVTLAGQGKPVNQQNSLFTVKAGNSTCSFTVPVLVPVGVVNNDHFPLTAGSYWNYDDLQHPGDTVSWKIVDTASFEGNLYKLLQEKWRFDPPRNDYYRKAADDYFEYATVDKYTNSFQYAVPLPGLLPFLKENLTTGQNWTSDEFSAAASFGQTIIIHYRYACTDANATVTINGKAFTNVYKMETRIEIKSVNNPYGPTGEIYLTYYAKGIGLIYSRRTVMGFTQSEIQIRNWQVN